MWNVRPTPRSRANADAPVTSSSPEEIGMLRPGMLADLAVIDHDITRMKPETIRDARVMLTMVGGRVVFDRDGVTH